MNAANAVPAVLLYYDAPTDAEPVRVATQTAARGGDSGVVEGDGGRP